jgi:hypothetical protein
MKVVKWKRIDPEDIIIGDVIKWIQECPRCSQSTGESRIMRVVNVDACSSELIVKEHDCETSQIERWPILKNKHYMRRNKCD